MARLANETMGADGHQITFDATGLSSGVYFYRLNTPGGAITKNLIGIK